MIYIFVAVTIVSSVLFTTDMILRYMEKIKSFGSEKQLFKMKGSTIPIECFLPQNVTMLIVFFMILGIAGTIMTLMGLYWYFTLPCAAVSGSLGIFIYQYPYKLLKKRVLHKTAPVGDAAAGVEGYALEFIPAGDYGAVELEWNGEIYRVNAMSANNTVLREYERVIIIIEEDGLYFVESITEVFDVLNSKNDAT